jgi:DNA-directed RNA polymerase specialized sigma24 family protein
MEEAHWAHFKWHLPTLTIGDFRSEAYWIATGEGAELVGAILRQRVRDRLTRFALRERDRKSKIDQLDDTHQNLDVDFLPPPERCRKSGWIYRMPCKQRRVLELIKIDGKDRWEVAAELGVSEATVSRKYTAAMERLKILCKKAA